MANLYKNAQFNLTTTAITDIYTCPTGRTALMKNVHVSNYGTGNVVVKGHLYDDSATTSYQVDQHTLSAGNSQDLSDGILVLESGDIFRLEAGSANSISGSCSILEIFDEKSP
jgi:hypothetical protein